MLFISLSFGQLNNFQNKSQIETEKKQINQSINHNSNNCIRGFLQRTFAWFEYQFYSIRYQSLWKYVFV